MVFGATAASSLLSPRVRAQSKVHRVGFLTLDPTEEPSRLTERLRDLGYVEGVNLSVAHRSAEGDPQRLPVLADELVRAKPDVLVAGWGTLAPKALKAATSTIPIVFSAVGDPVGAGVVGSLARPGGNVTGQSGQSAELKGKQLQLLKEVIPGLQVLGVLLNPDTPYSALSLEQLRVAAARDGTRLELLETRTPDEFSAAKLDALVASGIKGLMVVEDPLTSTIRDTVVHLATKARLPTIAGPRDYAVAGALMAYGQDRRDIWRRTAAYVDKILKGATPADLPVEQPTRFQLVVNLKTAEALGVAIPPTLLARADEVIE